MRAIRLRDVLALADRSHVNMRWGCWKGILEQFLRALEVGSEPVPVRGPGCVDFYFTGENSFGYGAVPGSEREEGVFVDCYGEYQG